MDLELIEKNAGWITAFVVAVLSYINNKRQVEINKRQAAVIEDKSRAESKKISAETGKIDTDKELGIAEQALKLADRYRQDIEASGKKIDSISKALDAEIAKNKMCEDQLKRTIENAIKEIEVERGRNKIFESEVEKLMGQLESVRIQLEKIKNGEVS